MIVLLLVVAAVFGVDFFLKRKVDEQLVEGEEREIFDGKAILTKHYNEGFAMNTLKDSPMLVKILNIVVAAIFIFCYTLIVREKGGKVRKVGCAMVLGGGLSNLYDRLVKGHVIDYIRIPFKKLKSLSKIIFNLSDVMIAIGSILILFGGSSKKR